MNDFFPLYLLLLAVDNHISQKLHVKKFVRKIHCWRRSEVKKTKIGGTVAATATAAEAKNKYTEI